MNAEISNQSTSLERTRAARLARTRAPTADSLSTNARLTAGPQHLVRWRMQGGHHLFFEKQNEQFGPDPRGEGVCGFRENNHTRYCGSALDYRYFAPV